MATRQYIGARYVPKFYDFDGSPEWRSGVSYENLTIVTRNGNSYTSKKVVPSNIGTPENNPEYWVSTGIYNEQVEEYRQLVVSVSGRVDDLETNLADEVDAREVADTNLSQRITDEAATREAADIELANSTELNLSARQFLFVGDSYIASHNNTCVEQACAKLGITNYHNISVSGDSFHDGSFLSQITNYSGDKNEITDIFVLGGMNDSNSGQVDNTLNAAIDAFFNYTHSNYPNAKISVCFTAHALDNSTLISGRVWMCRYWTLWAYKTRTLENGGIFYDDMWQALIASTTLLGSDKIHPSSSGQSAMCNYLVKYITGKGDSKEIYPPFGGSGVPNLLYYISEGNIEIDYVGSLLELTSVRGTTFSGNSEINITQTLPFYVNQTFTQGATIRGYKINNVTHRLLNAYIVAEGQRLYVKLNQIVDSGYESLTCASDGNIAIDKLHLAFPIVHLL